MKKIIFFTFFIASTFLVQAQLRWTIRLGTKTILQTKGEDEINNVLKLTKDQIGDINNLTLSYRPTPDEKSWKRTVTVDDSTGAGIMEVPADNKKGKSSATICYTIPNAELKKLLLFQHTLKIYSTSLPTDPAKAALVRVRKVHISTISLQ